MLVNNVVPSYNDALIKVYPPTAMVPVTVYASDTALNLSVANVLLNEATGADGAVGVPKINLSQPLTNVTATLLS